MTLVPQALPAAPSVTPDRDLPGQLNGSEPVVNLLAAGRARRRFEVPR
jgi:hypothetical protein